MPSEELLTTAQARALLGVGKKKMAQLLASGDLPTTPDPLDKRVKLIRRADVEALINRSSKKAA